jgi:hypothetical protein
VGASVRGRRRRRGRALVAQLQPFDDCQQPVTAFAVSVGVSAAPAARVFFFVAMVGCLLILGNSSQTREASGASMR